MFSVLEHKSLPLASTRTFVLRVLKFLGVVGLVIFFALMLGTVGYHYLGEIEWIDALHNAAMILAGMGPVSEMKTVSAKLFSTFYALFSGIAFLGMVGILLAPFYHRMIHQFHLEQLMKADEGAHAKKGPAKKPQN